MGFKGPAAVVLPALGGRRSGEGIPSQRAASVPVKSLCLVVFSFELRFAWKRVPTLPDEVPPQPPRKRPE